jgi:hypothetical protein
MQQNTGVGGITTKDKTRTITNNVDEKISSLQWRREVLQRVQKLFEIVIKQVKKLIQDFSRICCIVIIIMGH